MTVQVVIGVHLVEPTMDMNFIEQKIRYEYLLTWTELSGIVLTDEELVHKVFLKGGRGGYGA